MEKYLHFNGTRNYLSNFYQCKAKYYDRTFSSAEAAYQWTKAIITGQRDIATKIEYCNSGPIAKQLSKTLEHINNHSFWINNRKDILTYIVTKKFVENPHLMFMLKNTGSTTLIENTTDNYWGIGKNNDGSNEMGKILMNIRGKEDESIKREMEILEENAYDIIAKTQTNYADPYMKFIKVTNLDITQEMRDAIPKTSTHIQYTIIGDSIVRDTPAGKDVKVISISGAKITHVTNYIMDNPLETHNDIVIIQVGTNHVGETNIPMRCIQHQYKLLLSILRQQLPTTPIVLLAILPRPKDQKFNPTEVNYLTEHRKQIISIQRNACIVPGVYYRNCNKAFTKDKLYRTGIFHSDGIHLTEKGKEVISIGINRIVRADLQDITLYLKQRRKTMKNQNGNI